MHRIVAALLAVLIVLGSVSVAHTVGVVDASEDGALAGIWPANEPTTGGGSSPQAARDGTPSPTDAPESAEQGALGPVSVAALPVAGVGSSPDVLHPVDAGVHGVVAGGELRLRPERVAADADGDGLTDRVEHLRDTDPVRTDTDGDGLTDTEEIALGLDPTGPDTDGDGLLDGWEVEERTPSGVALPGADPFRMDLYVQVNYGAKSTRLTEEDREIIREAFARMPVDNPDGSTGIAVHIDDTAPLGGRLASAVAVTGPINERRLKSTYYTKPHLEDRSGIYHQVLVVDIDDGVGVAGFGDVPGHFVVIDADRTRSYSGTIPLRDRAIVHELLHNVVGRVGRTEERSSYLPDLNADDPYHTDEGWLYDQPRNLADHEFLPEHVAEQLEEEGFESPA